MGKMENVPKYYVFFPLDREFDWLIVIYQAISPHNTREQKHEKRLVPQFSFFFAPDD